MSNFSALTSKNFRLYILGSFISVLNEIKSDMEKEYSRFYIKNNIVFPSAVWIIKAEK